MQRSDGEMTEKSRCRVKVKLEQQKSKRRKEREKDAGKRDGELKEKDRMRGENRRKTVGFPHSFVSLSLNPSLRRDEGNVASRPL